MDRKVVVTIDALGRPTVEAVGFQGGTCADVTQAIESALAGSGGVERVLKPEWYEHSDVGQHEQETQW